MRTSAFLLAGLLVALLGCGDDDTTIDGGLDSGSDASRDARTFDALPEDGAMADASEDGSAFEDSGTEDGGTEDGGTEDSSTDDAGSGSRFARMLERLEAGTDDPEEADSWIREIAAEEGWPLREGGRWLFLTRWNDAPEGVNWVGDVNEFTPGDHPATALATGAHYYAVVETDAEPAGSKYKWQAQETFRAAPEAQAYGFDEFGEFSYVAPPADSPWLGRLGWVNGAELPAWRAVRVAVPAGYTGGAIRVLLLHDGQNVFGPVAAFGGWRVDETLTSMREEIGPVLAVAVDNSDDRLDVYGHVEDTRGGGLADAYLDMLRDVVLPRVRARFDVAAAGDDLVMAGSSMGGLVSLYAGMTRPDAFSCVIGMSPTLGWGAYGRDGSDALVNRWSERSVAVYLDSGGGGTCSDLDEDGVMEDSDDEDNFCVTNQLRDHLASLGHEFGVDLFHWHEPGAGHNEAAWRVRMPRALRACVTAGWSAD